MILSKLDDCIKRDLIRKMPPSGKEADKSVLRAENWLQEAKAALKAGIYDSCILISYEAMFHAIRSLLIRDGFRERSHYCIARYVEEKYVNAGSLDRKVVNLIDEYRDLRHNIAYGLEFEVGAGDAIKAIKSASLVIDNIKRIV